MMHPNKPTDRKTLCRLAVPTVTGSTLTLGPEQSHYVTHVLRLSVGQALTVFDAAGLEARAHVTVVTHTGVCLELEASSARPPPAVCLSMGLAIPKGERSDWAVEKLTELGVARIAWLHCERSVVRTEAAGQRHERWARVATAAAQQSRRVGLPELVGPMSLKEFLTFTADHRLLGDAAGEPLLPWVVEHRPRSLLLAIGPEGGFTAAELQDAEARDVARVSLNLNILRVETAAVTAAAMALGLGVSVA